MSKRYEAYRDGVLMYSTGEVIDTPNAVIEVLYKNKSTDNKTYFAEIKGTTLCAHGDTIEEAIEEALYKDKNKTLTEADKEKYKNPEYKFSVPTFRRLTGACKTGIDAWLEEKGLDNSIKMTLSEFKRAGGKEWADKLENVINGVSL